MQKIFVNTDENRVRSGWRILIVSSIALFLTVLLSVFSQTQLWISMALCISVLTALWFAAVVLDKRPFRNYGFNINRLWFKEVAIGFSFAAIAMTIIFLIKLGSGWATFNGFGWNGVDTIDFLIALVGYFVLMIAVSLWEEAYFRGYLIRNLEEGFNVSFLNKKSVVFLAVILSSVFFGIMHMENPNSSVASVLNITIAGLVLAYPYVVTGNLALSIGGHIAWNFFQGGIYGLPVSGSGFDSSLIIITVEGPSVITGGDFGPEAGAAGLFGLLLLMLFIHGYLNRNYKKWHEDPLTP